MDEWQSLRPQYFVMRQNDSMVPLIAMDELPPTLTICGVPRTLTRQDLQGMECVGNKNSRHRTYVVNNPKLVSAQQQGAVEKGLLPSAFASTIPSYHTMASPPSIVPLMLKAYGIEEQYPSGGGLEQGQSPGPSPERPYGTPLRVDRNPRPGSSSLPLWHDASSLPLKAASGMKEYCSYWLRHGECDYAQQGCLYKHEMPLDRRVLERLGLRDIPKWYREKHGLGSFLAGDSSIGSLKSSAMEKDWRAARAADDRERERDAAPPAAGKGTKTSKFTSSPYMPMLETSSSGTLCPRRWEQVLTNSPQVRSTLQEEIQRRTLVALEADKLAEAEKKRALNRFKGGPKQPEKERGRLSPPPSFSSGESSTSEGADSDWVEGSAEERRAAIAERG